MTDRLRHVGGEHRPDHGTIEEEAERARMHHRSIHRHRAGQYALAVVGTLATLTAIILLALGTTAFVRTSEQVKLNSQFRTDLEASRREGSIANASSELAECGRNNKQDRLLARLLGFSATNRAQRGEPLSQAERVFLQDLMESLRPVDCHTLPTVALTEERYGPIPTPKPMSPERHYQVVPNEGGHPTSPR